MKEPTAAPAKEVKLEAVPASWPGAFGVYKHSRDAVMFNLGSYIGILALIIAVSLAVTGLATAINLPDALSSILQYVAQIVLSIAALLMLFASVDRVKMTVGESLEKSKPFIVQYFILAILTTAIAVASLVALIVPFFFIVPRILLAPYLLVRRNLSAVDALKASWEMTQGNVGKIYGLIGVNVLFSLLAITLIGLPFAIYFFVMYSAAFNVLYEFVTKHKPVAA